MVLRLVKLFQVHRLRRFREVMRTEGRRAALRGALREAKRAWYGHTATTVTEGAPSSPDTPGTHALTAVWTDLARNGAFHATAAPAIHRRRRRVAMIGDLNLPQCRKYRVEQLDEMWAAADVDYGYAHYEDIPRCVELLQRATHLMLYRLGHSSLTDMYLYEARRLRLPVIYDIDDPLFSFAAYETYGNGAVLPEDLRRRLVMQSPSYLSVMAQADFLSLSTPGLVEEAAAHLPRPAYLRRNFADRATLEAGRLAGAPRRRSGFTVAFASGSLGHEADFLTIIRDLEAFFDGADDRRLLVLGRFDSARLPEALAARADVMPFADYGTYLSALARADCAILPLADDAFNRCKSAVRVIDASSVGVASVVGQVGDAQAMVRDRETGLVVEPGAGGWLTALERLAHDPNGVASMGRAARFDLERRWAASTDLPVVAPELLAEIRA